MNTARFGLYKETLKDGDPVSGVTPVKGDQVIKDLGIQGVNPQDLSAMGVPDHGDLRLFEYRHTGWGHYE